MCCVCLPQVAVKMNGTKMSRNKSPHTKIGQQVNKKNGTSFNDLDYNMDSNDGFNTQLPSNLGMVSLLFCV